MSRGSPMAAVASTLEEQRLAEAKMKVEKIVFSADGSVSTQSADLG